MSNLRGLRICRFCHGLDDTELNKISSIVSYKKLQKNQILFLEGDPAHGFFVLLSGKVKIYKSSPDGKEYTLHIIQPGQIFAEAAIFKGDIFPADCIALDDSEVAFFPKKPFLDLLTESPQISLKIIAGLSAFVRDFNRQLEELSLKEVPARLASYLLNRYHETGSAIINIETSKSELAHRLGTIIETLSRNFRKFKELKAVEVDQQTITLLDIPLLEQIADGKKI